MIIEAIRTRIVSQPTVAGKLAQWDFGDGTMRPAIFALPQAPPGCPSPVLLLHLMGGTEIEAMASNRATDGLESRVRCTLWGDNLLTGKPLRGVAYDIHGLFFGRHRRLEVPGWSFVRMAVSPPASLTDGAGFPGYIFDIVTTHLLERSA